MGQTSSGTGSARVLEKIDADELYKLILDLGNIASHYRQERQAGEFVYSWMQENGFEPRMVSFSPDRPNVVGALRGTGGGKDLVFNAHLDTAVSPDDALMHVHPEERFFSSAWVEKDCFMGEGVQNDKGPLACFLMAAKAIKESGVRLGGSICLTASCGETGLEPVDEFQGPSFHSKDFSTRYLLTHGGIAADYALVAEGTDFALAAMEAGKAFFKITVYGKITYTPWLERELSVNSPNVFVKTSYLIQEIERWAARYESQRTYHSPLGEVVPKVQISAVRGGQPYYITKGSEICHLYLDVRLPPGLDPREPRTELESVLRGLGVEGRVELFLYRRGYEAVGAEAMIKAIKGAHRTVLARELPPTKAPFSSMWRDTNPFNEMGIPSVTYGPTRRCPIPKKDMLAATKVYALTALELCG